MTTIHYFYDPMCGWCYGATELIDTLNKHARQHQWQLKLHPGGMIERRALDSGFRQHILQADPHIAQLTGVEFGEAYLARIAGNSTVMLDSMLTTTAILAANQLGVHEIDMLKAIQKAHYQRGLDVAEADTLQMLASEQGISPDDWEKAMQDNEQELKPKLRHSQHMMAQLGVQGFPTLLAETEEGWLRLPHSDFYGKPELWQQILDQLNA